MDVHLDPAGRPPAVSPAQPVAATPAAPDAPASGRTADTRGADAQTADRPADADRAAIAHTVTQLQDHVQSLHRELRFRVDETTGQVVVRVVEAETGRLIRQIPNQNVLDLAAFLESVSGLLLRERA
ncbi:flagellar protein FlaG [Immundisolibacter sp.]|uniref:flagellar protein FlaG n=1 Tax=Immundisolibacter sp. TaxID=1934948 RepID=UPI00260509F7|nr:flagellar protein FlaG [Immundisolibacter sp.]MDD3650265.1 flagellar protein FlaG [Immundisolibacter sp.]